MKKKTKAIAYTNGDKPRIVKKIISAVLIVGLAAATTFLAGMSSEEESLRLEKESFDPKPAIEYVVDMPEPTLTFDESEQERVHKVRSKKWSILSIPMWLAGHLATLLLKPLLGPIITYAFIALVFFGILCLCLKTIFPDTPLRELLTKRNLLTFACTTAVFIAALHVPQIMKMDSDYHGMFTFLAGALAVLTMVLLCTEPKKEKEEA